MLNKFTLPDEEIVSKIYFVNDNKVMLDTDLALLYEIPTKRLNEQVKRNRERFPPDFMFQLSDRQWKKLRSQIATANTEMRRNNPYVFTEHGILMLSSVLSNRKAVQVNIQLMRIFTKMRDLLLHQNDLYRMLESLENRLDETDDRMNDVIQYLQRFVKPSNAKIGYQLKSQKTC